MNCTLLDLPPRETALSTPSISLARSLGRLCETSNRRTRWEARVSLSNMAISSRVRRMLRPLSRIIIRLAGA
jgi:hypothetical protein